MMGPCALCPESLDEHRGPGEVRDRDGAAALSRVPGHRPAVHLRGGDRAALLPRQLRGPAGPRSGRRGLLPPSALRRLALEAERRFCLANAVDLQVREAGAEVYFELKLSDAWVWDMYRPARFVRNVRVLTFKDVNVEEPDKPDLALPGRRRPARFVRDVRVLTFKDVNVEELDKPDLELPDGPRLS